MQDTFEVIRMARLLAAERAQLVARGPQFCIYHHFWQIGTICTPGEVIADIQLWHRTKRISLPLGLRLAELFDYLARHQHLAQCAAHIAAGLSVDPFTRQHGAYADAKSSLSKKVSRTSVKQQIIRLRDGLRRAFREAGLNLDPCRVLISEKTTVNEVRYRLRGSVTWEHFEF
jgi:hypothetical protein